MVVRLWCVWCAWKTEHKHVSGDIWQCLACERYHKANHSKPADYWKGR